MRLNEEQMEITYIFITIYTYALHRINSQPILCYLISFHFLKSVKVIVLRVTLS